MIPKSLKAIGPTFSVHVFSESVTRDQYIYMLVSYHVLSLAHFYKVPQLLGFDWNCLIVILSMHVNREQSLAHMPHIVNLSITNLSLNVMNIYWITSTCEVQKELFGFNLNIDELSFSP